MYKIPWVMFLWIQILQSTIAINLWTAVIQTAKRTTIKVQVNEPINQNEVMLSLFWKMCFVCLLELQEFVLISFKQIRFNILYSKMNLGRRMGSGEDSTVGLYSSHMGWSWLKLWTSQQNPRKRQTHSKFVFNVKGTSLNTIHPKSKQLQTNFQ
jgi:hypothetical protein